MKHFIHGMMISLALILALVLGVAALAENAEPEVPELPAVEDAQAPATDGAATDSTASTALQDALNAYDSARQSARQENLEAELKEYVEAGKLTQEQADLILNYAREQQALRNGTCPNCGYQFRNNANGRGGKGNRGGKGGFGGKGNRGGMFGMNGQQPFAGMNGQAAPDANADGAAYMPDAQAVPFMGASEGI